MKTILSAMCLSLCLSMVACGDDDTTADATPDTSSDATSTDDATTQDDASADDASADDASADDASADDAAVDDADLPPEGTECTSLLNADCEANEVCDCTNRNDSKCFCIEGARGDVPYGGDCADDNKVCESALCVDNKCTATCSAPDECQPPFTMCNAIGICRPAS